MVQSINTKVDLVMNGNSHMGLTDYGKIMVGDNGFEFYDDSNVRNFIQIPWTEVNYVVVSVMFGGHWIPRFSFQTKRNGMITFSAKDPKKVLRAVRKYIEPDHIVKSLTFFQVLGRIFKGKNNKDKYLK
ncbi:MULTISPECIES: DUF956 family protein [Lactiplantibacillus]|uniref:DUF956 family protein n=2 Tax=Lactiplantibacillus TaxID=2767842 RepID=A0AAW8WHH4_LACPE|nr:MULTISPECIES: DUF956 family protein [Lactiplantibacillus]AUI79678.1 hypothetical protein BB562_13820 [Lactiplantibacillus pentosus]MBU7461175.1 DUF956 family protein [Lactiplantibacillus pentosus]MBU7476983.1 DUF956 family protein [Lactiplantibacillus pentosus]MBU7483907.1 DUF956 family protein [Lactiplantibacillus sp. 30.2.29]MBU7487074.1 DUF956 family protein [Lactiplantibacillus pentosus]